MLAVRPRLRSRPHPHIRFKLDILLLSGSNRRMKLGLLTVELQPAELAKGKGSET
jgi:hypothetical protein